MTIFFRYKRIFFLLLYAICFVFPKSILAQNLQVEINESLPVLVKNNVTAYLGTLPETTAQRALFVLSAKSNIEQSLKAIGYYRAHIVTTINRQDNKHWLMNVSIDLRKPTRLSAVNVEITGDALSDADFKLLLKKIPFKSGDILNHGLYEQFKSDLLTLGQSKGYFDGSLQQSQIAIKQGYQSAIIKLHYNSKKRYKFGTIDVDQKRLDQSIIKALVPFESGDFYSSSQLAKFQQNLQSTGYFSQTLVQPEVDAREHQFVPINVTLRNKQKHHFDIGIGYATDTDYRISAVWRTPLVNRYGHRQQTRIKYSKINPTASFIYTIGLTHPLNDVFQTKISLADDVFADFKSHYFSTTLARVRNEQGWIRQHYVKYLSENWHLSFDSEDDHQAKYLIPGLTWALTKRKGSVIDPSDGISQWYNIEAGSENAGSALNFVRFNARFKYIQLFSSKHRFVAKAELGALISSTADEQNLAPSLRFYAGGDYSLRGYSYQSIGTTRNYLSSEGNELLATVGGTRLATISLEYQYYFREKWRAALFTDAGDAAEEGKFQLKYSVGTGLHYISPVGALRFDFAYNISRDNPNWHVHFTLGAEL